MKTTGDTRTWTDDQLRQAVENCSTWRAVARVLGLKDKSGFSLRGCAVALPVEPQEYDLLVTTTKGVQRVQVKSCAARTRTGYWHVGVGHRPYVLDKSASKMPHDPDSIDLFFIVLGDGSIYGSPSSVLAGRIGIHAENYAPYRVGDVSGLMR